MSNTPDLSPMEWVKSSYSGNGGGNCLEWAPSYAMTHGVAPVHDSKNPGPILMLRPGAWAGLVEYAKQSR
ncbi:DUF397 domain-containing protein [Streptomyces sp. BPTC-684]|uniref:DUF397 domain-containing protein n=1 Tax=Streptomyces sp. BPTC-684 TaxID=3043734 RepID=UPI0024B235F3|nr:DUF397 domain-containing protein [Streptomyces sp. BPTC-684]WHM37028.1 DUF397 domain-containing protein [Streptomyces sp. BPTC-684]